jgi:hypothetical protein
MELCVITLIDENEYRMLDVIWFFLITVFM